jgi:hypothetical protein
MEQKLKNHIRELYGQVADNDYNAEMSHPPNKIDIIKNLINYIHMEREALMKIIYNNDI